MKLLLDEHYSQKIAVQLRKKGFDVVAVAERLELQGLPDRALLEVCSSEARVLLTNNVGDFILIVKDLQATGEHHHGIVFTSDNSMPRSSKTIGTYVKELTNMLRERPATDSLVDQTHWLRPS